MKNNIVVDNYLTAEDVEKLEREIFTAGLSTRLGLGNDRYYIKRLVKDLIIAQNKLLRAIQNKQDFKQKILRLANSRARTHSEELEECSDFYRGYQRAWEDMKEIIKRMN